VSLLLFIDFTVDKYSGNLLAVTDQLTNVNKEAGNKAIQSTEKKYGNGM